MPKIGIIEDEKNISDMIKYNLEKEGYEVFTAYDGKEGLELVEKETLDLLLLDIMLPHVDGLDICKKVRQKMDTPIMIISAKADEFDKVLALELGADDYVTKPFSVPELLARIKTNLRRVSTTNQLTKKEYTFQDIRLDTIEKKVFRGENYVRLGPTEFRILKLLIANPRHVFSREDLLREVWGNSVYVETRTVDVHIRRLRKALNEFGADYIRTIRATGYSIDDHEVEAEQ